MHEIEEIIYSRGNPSDSKRLSKMLAEGKIRKLLPKTYTSNLVEEDKTIIQRHLFSLIGKHYPGALISFRSALEMRPSPGGMFYLISTQNRIVKWPGVTLKFSKGLGPIDGDNEISQGLFAASLERTYLENLINARSAGGERKTISREMLEERLSTILDNGGEKALNDIRDQCRVLSRELELDQEFNKLNKLIAAILQTHSEKALQSERAQAYAAGAPYDPFRLELFNILLAALRSKVPRSITENAITDDAFQNFAFYESYFSNYIEGTQFEIDEARELIFDHKEIPNRTGDSHDMKGTFEICSSQFEMSKEHTDYTDFEDILLHRHATIMRGRPDKNPGEFKNRVNRAGNTVFVDPGLVKGSLEKALGLMKALSPGIQKAIFIMFAVSEIHPFMDGNGRAARIMMNAELVKAKEQRILIPTAYREDYLLALRKLSRQKDPEAFIHMMERIHEYSAHLDPLGLSTMQNQLIQTNAFDDDAQAKLKWP